MPLTPIAGSTRLRAFQLGLESTFKTAVPATRRLPWAVVPTVDPHWTFTTADTGTLDQAIAPYRQALDVTVAATGQLFSNDAPTVISAGVQGNLSLTGGSTAKTLQTTVASTSQDVFDTYTAEVYDDASADAWAFTGGVINDFTLEYPQDGSPINLTANWRFAKVVYVATPTAGLSVDTSPVPLFAADTQWSVNDTAGSIGNTQFSDQIYGGSISVNNNLDVKRMANGNSTRFEVTNYGRGERVVSFSFQFAKATAAIAESVKWIAAAPSERFAEIRTLSVTEAQSGVAHELRIRIPGYWITRAWDSVNTNTSFTLAGTNVYDPTLGYPFSIKSVSSRTAL
jgi:hypothetical protein